MTSPVSTLDYQTIPSAIVSDGAVVVPIWAISSISLSESYHLPPIGASGAKAVVSTHDDTVTLTGVLVGPDRYTWKLALETLADIGKRGSALAAATGGRVGGLILISGMTIRTDMQIQTLSFTASSAKRDVLDVSLSMAYMPLPGPLGKLLDFASLAVGSLADWTAKR
jgi:hypothetical protein